MIFTQKEKKNLIVLRTSEKTKSYRLGRTGELNKRSAYYYFWVNYPFGVLKKINNINIYNNVKEKVIYNYICLIINTNKYPRLLSDIVYSSSF